MQRLHGIIGDRRDPALATLLHQVEHEGGVEILHVPEADLARGRLRATTDRGTDCALSLDRDERLFDGAVLLLDRNRAIVVRAGAPQTLRFRAVDKAAALRLGFMAGHLHWRIRFEDEDIVVLLDGSAADTRARIAGLLAEGQVVEVSDGA